ncbi:MAG: hypothetical protein LBH25_01210, partial [Fibromonadaceae bacterium]|nr:hypothetical protein [Fibromonadaceae bacterium]
MRTNRFLFTAIIMFAITFTLTSCGPSKAELAIMSAPSIGEVSGLKNKLIWLEGNAQSGGNYVLEIGADEIVRCGFLSSCFELSYKDKSNITIILKGIGANRTIGFVMNQTTGAGGAARTNNHSGFTIGSGVTLVLDDNITLKGGTQEFAFVRVYSGGTLVMNDGSTINGATNNNNEATSKTVFVFGAGVCVYNGGTFIMKGGTISGNTIRPRQLTVGEVEQAKAGYALGRSLVEGGKKAVEKTEEKFSKIEIRVGGAGVYVSGGVAEYKSSIPSLPWSKPSPPAPSGTFIKTGGTITGYSSDSENGNVVRDAEGNVLNGFGHAMSFGVPTYASEGKEPKVI